MYTLLKNTAALNKNFLCTFAVYVYDLPFNKKYIINFQFIKIVESKKNKFVF